MSDDIRARSFDWRWDAAIALLLALLAFAVRIDRIGFNSLSEDESAKWLAVKEYRQGHFAGVNSEHPMLPKLLEWASLATGERWERVASFHRWRSMNAEGWLRLPNVLFGAATAAILYLFCRQMMGVAGSFAGGFLLGGWAIADRIESASQGGNAGHVLHLAGLLLLLPGETGNDGDGHSPMARPEWLHFWPRYGLTIPDSPIRAERTGMAFGRTKRAGP